MEALLDREEAARLSPRELRAAIARGRWTGSTAGLAPGYLQANLAIVPKEDAFDFLLFCTRNPKPCPLLEVTDPGSPEIRFVASGSDIRTDVPRYRVFRYGEVIDEPTDITAYWREDLVAFLLGCSLTFEQALANAGVPLRHLEAGRRIPIYVTNVDCKPAGKFQGPLVVSMRPIPAPLVPRAVEVTARYPLGHGAPVHIGAPEALGIRDLDAVDYGDPPVMKPGDVPVFWACGVTPQAVAQGARPAFMITHYPEHMYVTDQPADAAP